jgi:2-dehydropantoate 2-reductase
LQKDEKIQSVGIVGPGAIGGFLAALFWRDGISVTCVGTEVTGAVINRDGIRLESPVFGSFVAYPRGVPRLDQRVQVLFFTTKAPFLAATMMRVDPALTSETIIIPLLNGLEHLEILRARYGGNVVAGSIGGLEIWRVAPTHVLGGINAGRIELAPNVEVSALRLYGVADLVARIGLDTAVKERENEVLWGKLVRLSVLAAITSASGESLGYARQEPHWRELLERACQEATAVAKAEGLAVRADAVMAQIEAIPGNLRTSMQRDIEAGRPSELDAIIGAVVRAGARHGLDCPIFKKLITIIQQRLVRRQSCDATR